MIDDVNFKSFGDDRNLVEVAAKIVGERKLSVSVSDIEMSQEQKEKLLNGLTRGCELAEKVLGVEAFEGYEKGIDLKVVRNSPVGLMNPGFEVDASILNMTQESIGAAILHELVEAWREERGFPNGGIEDQQMLAEYLFCGEDRNIFKNYILKMFDGDGIAQTENHWAGFLRVKDLLMPEDEVLDLDPESIWEKVQTKKKNMSEEEKVELIKSVVLTKEHFAEMATS